MKRKSDYTVCSTAEMADEGMGIMISLIIW